MPDMIFFLQIRVQKIKYRGSEILNECTDTTCQASKVLNKLAITLNTNEQFGY